MAVQEVSRKEVEALEAEEREDRVRDLSKALAVLAAASVRHVALGGTDCVSGTCIRSC